jgi:hypothetical protein
LARFRHELDDPRDIGGEPKVEESIRLIEDEHANLRKITRASGHEVEQAAGRRHGDVSATAQRELLIAVADPSVERHDPSGAVASQRRELGSDLRAELTRWNDHEREGRGRTAVDPLEDREGECAGFPGAGLGLSEEIASGAKVRDR